MADNDRMDKLVSLCKRRGFVFQSSEIYGGVGSVWDYGPLGVELKRNIKDRWWRAMVHARDDIEGLDAGILMHPKVWEASGHVAGFTDPLVDCRTCKSRFRADKLGEAQCPQKPSKHPGEHSTCDLTEARQFNLMFKTFMGPVEETAATVFLRPETAQGIYVNFLNVLQGSRQKMPFGIAQIGKAFRNEITPGNFIFRTREFEQMEIEYFCKPGTQDEHYAKWIESRFDWYVRYGIKKENLRLRVHEKDELAHYARGCTDIEYFFPMGWSELEGIASRGDYDLNQHAKHSGKTLDYFDDETKQKVVPYVVEPAAGVDRGMLAFLCDAYREEQVKEEKRVVLGFHPEMAPVKVAVLPLLKKRDDIVTTARGIAETLRKKWITVYDDTAAIGKLYRRQDEVGTPYCITVDVQTVGDAEKGEAADRKVTVRERDTMDQIRVPIEKLPEIMEIVLTKGWSARPQ